MSVPTVDTLLSEAQILVSDLQTFKISNDAQLAADAAALATANQSLAIATQTIATLQARLALVKADADKLETDLT